MKNILLLVLLALPSLAMAQRTQTIDADCLRIKDGACITKTELGSLSGASSSLQDQIDAIDATYLGLGNVDNTSDANKPISTATQTALDGKVNLTGNESISGTKTFTGKIDSSSTANGNRPCPVMTEAQMLAVVSPNNGDCVYNSTKKGQFVYSSVDTKWKANGGGAGGSRLNILADSSFEDGPPAAGVCVNCTATRETSVVMVTPNNEASLKLEFSAAGTYTLDTTTGSNFDGVSGFTSCHINASTTGVSFKSRRNGADVNTASVNVLGSFIEVPIATVMGATSDGLKIETTGAATVYLDECFEGPGSKVTSSAIITPLVDYGPITITATTTNPTKPTTREKDNVSCRRDGPDYECIFLYEAASATGGALGSGEYIFTLPTGIEMDTSKVSLVAGTLGSGFIAGKGYVGTGFMGYAGSGRGAMYAIAYTSTSFRLMYESNMSGLSAWSNSYGAGWTSANHVFRLVVRFPGQGLSSTTETYSQQCQNDLDCTDTLTAQISATGVPSKVTSPGWLTGNCVITSTGIFTCPVATAALGLTQPMSCRATYTDTGNTTRGIKYDDAASTTSNVVFIGHLTNTTGYAAIPFSIACNRVFPDRKVRRVIEASLKNVPKTPGLTLPEVVRASVSGTEVITDNESSLVSSCTNAAPSVCTFTTAFVVKPLCWSQGASSYVSANTTTTTTVERATDSTPFTLFCLGGR